MKPIRILSIDFDYFIDTDIHTRNNIFPDGADEMPLDELKKKWDDVYVEYPFVNGIGVISQYDVVKDLLSKPQFIMGKNVIAYPSHKEIYNTILQNFPTDVPLEIYNIDFHHDMYHYHTEEQPVNCSNWARQLLEERPNTKYTWYRRIDSEIQTLFGEVECYHSPFMILELKKIAEEIDFIFICESLEWTPPHLFPFYTDLVKTTIK